MVTTKKLRRQIGAALLACALTGCATQQDTGRVVGAASGAAIGSQIGDGGAAQVIVGTLVGAAVGDRVGAHMDRDDERKTLAALEGNRSGESAAWRNPDTGADWSFTPTRTFDRNSRPCREFHSVVRHRGEREVVDGVACRTDTGHWEVVAS